MFYVHTHGDIARPQVHVTASPARLAAELIAAAMLRSFRRFGRCRLVVDGGPAVAPVLEELRQRVDTAVYAQLYVTVAAERAHRFAPPEPARWQELPDDSALRQLMSCWLAHVPVRPQHILPMTLGGEAEYECVRFGREFKSVFAGGVDVALLATQADGAVAGLQPGHAALAVDDICMVVHTDVPVLTLGLPVLQHARHCVVVAEPLARQALVAAWAGQPDQPLARLQGPGSTYWLVDVESGRALLDQAVARDLQ